MTFPATYNISYYLGDTHEFNVYPKDASGAAFPMSTYTDVKFVIAPTRGNLEDPTQAIDGYAAFSPDKTYVQCAITPENSALMNPETQYVFDVKISKDSSPYNMVHTFLTGSVTIQDNVEDVVIVEQTPPNPPVLVTETDISENFITISWEPSTTGPTPDGYYIYVTPYSTDYEDFTVFGQFTEFWFGAVPEQTADTSFTITSTTAISSLGMDSVDLQPGTAYLYAVLAFNESGSSNPAGNFELIEATINETYTDGGS